jgi:hypothetical protein
MNLRDEFEIDCLFGMPGLPARPGMLKKGVEGKYRKDVEVVFQTWARGHRSCTVDVRNFFRRTWPDTDPVPAAILRVLQEEGLASK